MVCHDWIDAETREQLVYVFFRLGCMGLTFIFAFSVDSVHIRLKLNYLVERHRRREMSRRHTSGSVWCVPNDLTVTAWDAPRSTLRL